MNVKPFVDVLTAFEPLLQNEILSYTTLLESTYSMKTKDVEIRFQDDICQLGEEALRTRSKMDELTASAMKDSLKTSKRPINLKSRN